MEQLTWTGSFAFLNPVLFAVAVAFIISAILQIILSMIPSDEIVGVNPDGSALARGGMYGMVEKATRWLFLGLIAVLIVYLAFGAIMGTDLGIVGGVSQKLLPVWIGMIAIFALSIMFKNRLGLYGRLFDSPIGMVGFGFVLFWVLTAIFADQIITHAPLAQISGMKNKIPGTPIPDQDGWYFLGGDNLARDVFSRVVFGSRTVLSIAPFATLFAFMVGISLGLPAGYFGGRFDTVLSFIANLVLAFPVILLFYLLVTKDIIDTGIPMILAAVLFLFPILFVCVLFWSKYSTRKNMLLLSVGATLLIGLWIYLSIVVNPLNNPQTAFWQSWNGLAAFVDNFRIIEMDANLLNVFVSVVFVNAPTVFRIVRGLTIDIQTRDYVAAAQTRGESPWYIMLWEILPNARGPLIVDFCLRIGYTTILLGTLGFFGLGVSPESSDWGMTINEGRKLLSIYPHPALPPAVALMSLVLGLNLLADGLREQSLKD